jgi:hypothetical protein
MAKNIKLKDLLNEQDPRIAGYKTPSDRYLSKTGPDAQGNYQIDPKLAAVTAKATAKDVTAVKPAISPLKKSPLDRTREDDINDVADIVYDANGYIYDDEQEALTALKTIKNLEEWTYLETYFKDTYKKALDVYLNYFLDNRTVSKQFENWIKIQSWMPADVKQRYIAAVNYAEWDPTKGVFGPGGLGTAMYKNVGQPEVSIDVIHNALQGAAIILDFVPALGWIVSSGIELLDSGIYLAQGDYENAGYMAMFAALPMVPSAVTSLAKAGARLTKSQLSALSNKVVTMLKSGKTAAMFTKAEIAALNAMKSVSFQTEIAKAFVKDLFKKLSNKVNATKFVKQLKSASKEIQTKTVSLITKYADEVDNKFFTDLLIQNGFVAAGSNAIRLANAVTDAEMKSMQRELYANLNNYFVKQVNKLSGPFKGATWLENRYYDMKLTSLLMQEQKFEAEPIRAVNIPTDTDIDTTSASITNTSDIPEPTPKKSTKTKSKKKTASKSKTTSAEKTYSNNTEDFEAEEIKGLGDGEWSISDIVYWTAIGWGATKIIGGVLGAAQAANGLSRWLNGKGVKQGYLGFDKLRSLDVYQAFRMISDRNALKREGIILTRKEYRAITKDLEKNAKREMDYVLNQVRTGENPDFIAKSTSTADINKAATNAYKNLYRLTPGSPQLRTYAERIVNAVTKRAETKNVSNSFIKPAASTFATATPKGMPTGTKLSISQAAAFRQNPNLTWRQLRDNY